MTTTSSRTAPPVEATTIAGFPALAAHPAAGPRTRPPMLLLHGAFADETCFERWLPDAATAGFPAWSPARRGRHGIGPDRAAGLRFEDYVADTLAVIDALDEPPVLVGHSLGALVAQRVAELGRARALVLLAPAPPAMLTAQAVALPHFAPQLPRILTGRPFVVGGHACTTLALNELPEDERPAVHAHLTPESGRVYRSMLFGTVRIDADRVEVPVYVAGGDRDRIVSTRLLRKTARHYGTEAHVHEGRGHFVILEPGWEQLVADVLAWLDEVLAA